MMRASSTPCAPVSDWLLSRNDAHNTQNSPWLRLDAFHGLFVVLMVLGAYRAFWRCP